MGTRMKRIKKFTLRVSTIVGNNGFGRIVDTKVFCENKIIVKDLIEFRSMSNLITHDVRELVDRHI